jgi:hypothetical protein
VLGHRARSHPHALYSAFQVGGQAKRKGLVHGNRPAGSPGWARLLAAIYLFTPGLSALADPDLTLAVPPAQMLQVLTTAVV